ncbi:serine hydrolase [Rhabdothermincola salaria]|uniref:serine hydrolase n=1 Tax=Rhabdothermincola salaria TaxID=2903142 RepID=UPI001E6419C0|nr:serine hydrolase [Rhabdothermincola salaria]MCD9625205.1 serine hydrolase [Rhabdothermincola salaria]
MASPTPQTLEQTEPRDPPGPVRDRLLDVVRSIAVVRVVLWHTWSWAWLSWIPAMPAMFFGSGALLEASLEKRGWWATVRRRTRRLLVPFWVYAAACWALMLAVGWRPDPADAVGWFVPLVDPVGSDATPGLWITLWYVRAYLWFVLAAGVLSWLLRRIGPAVIALAAAGTFALWRWQESGAEVPLELGDAVTYAAFVLAGMWYWQGGRLSRPASAVLAGLAAVAALWWWQRLGPVDGVVNRSYPLMVLAGTAGIGLVLLFRAQLAGVSGLTGRAVDLIGRRALTIYLWQGFGLVAAEWLVEPLEVPAALGAVLAIAVVAAVIVAAVIIVGPIEDLAAGRSQVRTWDRTAALAVPGVGLLLGSLLVPIDRSAPVDGPLSGQAVVARAGLVEDSTGGPDGGSLWEAGMTVADVVSTWAVHHTDVIDDVGLTRIEGAYAAPGGRTVEFAWGADEPVRSSSLDEPGTPLVDADDPMAWYSITKAATTTWLLRSVEAGVVALDEPIATWAPEIPNADRITLEHLARHTSGIPSELDTDFFTADPQADLAAYTGQPELLFEPGEGFAYSRIGYHVLGLVLERANATTWRTAMEELARASGTRLEFDEDTDPVDGVTDPDGHGYRGMLWASGGLMSTVSDGARFFQWMFTDGLSRESRELMTSFSSDPDWWYYGLGLMPLCPCEFEDDRLQASRYGVDGPDGSIAIDGDTGATVMLRPDSWFDTAGPVTELYELQQGILDALAASAT